VNHPVLGTEPATTLTHTGTYKGTTVGAKSLVDRYRYPTEGDLLYPGPEVVYRFKVGTPIANFGVAVLSGHVTPHVVFDGDENHLVGFPGLPTNLNPYLSSFGEARLVAGSILPANATYEIVFDTKAGARRGPFSFRFWVNDTKPPKLRIVSRSGAKVVLSITDHGGAGIDPESIRATLDGHTVARVYRHGRLTIAAPRGKHLLIVTAADYQELKNMEDVAPIKPNTTILRKRIVVG
jgi:hypothetical protein